MRLAPLSIRLQVSVLLFLATLNTVLLAFGAGALYMSIAESPSSDRVLAVKTFEREFSAVHAQATEAVEKGLALPESTEALLDAAAGRLASLDSEASSVRDDLAVYRQLLDRWGTHLVSPSHSMATGVEDEEGTGIARELQRTNHHVVSGARQLVYFARPAWVDSLAPLLPLAALWLVVCSVLTFVLATGLRTVLSRPLERLTRAAQQISQGRLEVPIPAPEGAAEIQTLTIAIAGARARTLETIESLDLRNRQTETMLAQLGDGVVLTDASGMIVETNQQAEMMFSMLSADWPHRRAVADLLPELLQSWFSLDEDRTLTLDRLVAGRRTWVDVRMRRVARATARSGGVWVVVLHDITTRREVENIKRDFLSVVSHELKTPLVTVEGFTKLLLMNKGGGLTEKQRGWVQNIRDQGQVLLTLVTNLLDVTRLEGGNLTITTAPVPASELLAQWADTWRPVVEQRGLRFALSAGDTAHSSVSVDPFRMQQVVGNLLNNAMKFTKAPGEVGMGARLDGGRVVFRIWDTGRGIAADAIPHLFEKFYQVEKGDTRVAGGAGLGLYIAHQLTTAQNGRIVVESVVGEGTRFLLSFPAVPAPETSP